MQNSFVVVRVRFVIIPDQFCRSKIDSLVLYEEMVSVYTYTNLQPYKMSRHVLFGFNEDGLYAIALFKGFSSKAEICSFIWSNPEAKCLGLPLQLAANNVISRDVLVRHLSDRADGADGVVGFRITNDTAVMGPLLNASAAFYSDGIPIFTV